MALLRKGEAHVHLPEYWAHTYEAVVTRNGTCIWDSKLHRRYITSRYHLVTPPSYTWVVRRALETMGFGRPGYEVGLGKG